MMLIKLIKEWYMILLERFLKNILQDQASQNK